MAVGVYAGLLRRPEGEIDELRQQANREDYVGHCDTHPRYQAMRQPRVTCAACDRMWNRAKMWSAQ